MQTEEVVKRALERELGTPPMPGWWKQLVRERYVNEVQKDFMTIAELAAEYRHLVRASKDRGDARGAPRALPPNERLQVISGLLAEDAAHDPTVRRFRETHLGGNFLPPEPDKIAAWVEQQARSDGPPTRWAVVPLAEDGTVARDATPERADFRVLEYTPMPSEPEEGVEPRHVLTRRQPTARGGVLEELRRIALDLGERCAWPRTTAALFVLTGLTPPIPRIWVDRRVALGKITQWRVVLDVDVGVSPAEVAATYRSVRAEFRPPRVRRARRPRAPLVGFVRERPGMTWVQRLDAWNQAYPDSRYTAVTNMQRDYRRALKLATGEGGSGNG